MLRIVRLTAITALLAALWASLLNRTDLGDLHHRLVLYSPVLALLGFGAYLAAALLYGVLTFKTVPEEAESLAKEVAVAKADLVKKGITLAHS